VLFSLSEIPQKWVIFGVNIILSVFFVFQICRLIQSSDHYSLLVSVLCIFISSNSVNRKKKKLKNFNNFFSEVLFKSLKLNYAKTSDQRSLNYVIVFFRNLFLPIMLIFLFFVLKFGREIQIVKNFSWC
jgi:hypothetical protein